MHKHSIPFVWLGVFLGIALSLRAETPAAGKEMLVNPSFESCPSTTTAITLQNAEQFGFGKLFYPGVGWRLNPYYPTSLTVITDEKAAHTGKVCIKLGYLVPEATEKANVGPFAALCAGSFSVNPGEQYVFKFWARRDGTPGPATVFVYQCGEKVPHLHLDSVNLGQAVVNGDWQEYVFTYEVKNPETKSVSFGIHTPKGSDLYLDDVSLKKAAVKNASGLPAPVKE